MRNINARQARELVNTYGADGLDDILDAIRFNAENGQGKVYLDNKITESTRMALENRGFSVYDCPSIAIQKDGVYHYISW